jgi:iron complex outermembrane receptor protein
MPLLMISPSWAEDEIKLDEIVVTATRYEEKLPDIPADVTVITREDIQHSPAQNIPDLLRAEAGIHVYDIGGNRRSITVDLRGFGETAPLNTLVLVDGRRVNQADLGGVDWAQIPIDRLERIEIVRGGRGSVLYGDNAAGGVINIITKEGQALGGGGEIAGGSYGTFQSNAYFSGSSGPLKAYLSAGYLTSDGYRDNSDTEAWDFGVSADYRIGDFATLKFSSGYHKDETGLPGALKGSDFDAGRSRTDSTHPHDFMDIEDYYVQVSPEVPLSGENLLKIDMSYRKRDAASFSSGDWGNFTADWDLKSFIVSPQVLVKTDICKSVNSAVLGFDYQKTENDIANDSLFFGSRTEQKFDLSKENYGFYLHDDFAATGRLRLSAGYRHDWADFTFEPGEPDSVSIEKDAYTTGINYTFLDKSYAYLSYSRSFRYPVLDELYSFFTNTVSTNVVPQTSDDYEAGIRYYLMDSLYLQMNLFRIDTNDEIFFNPVTYQNENLDGPTRREGIEASVGVEIVKGLSLKGSYTYTDAEIRGGMFKGKSVPNVPQHMATFEALYSPGKNFTVLLNGVYVGERPFISDLPNAFGDQKSYVVLNSRIQYAWKTLSVYLDIYNIADKRYSEFGSVSAFPAEKALYPSPERNFRAGLKMAL